MQALFPPGRRPRGFQVTPASGATRRAEPSITGNETGDEDVVRNSASAPAGEAARRESSARTRTVVFATALVQGQRHPVARPALGERVGEVHRRCRAGRRLCPGLDRCRQDNRCCATHVASPSFAPEALSASCSGHSLHSGFTSLSETQWITRDWTAIGTTTPVARPASPRPLLLPSRGSTPGSSSSRDVITQARHALTCVHSLSGKGLWFGVQPNQRGWVVLNKRRR
jgi:hypothetical protein